MYEYTIWHVFVCVCIHILFKDDINNIWNFIACFESFHALVSLKVSEKNRRGAMQKSRGQQTIMETTRIIPMLFQKGIQRQYVGGEGEGRYDATFCGIEEKWESNTGCLKWRREPCGKRNRAVAPRVFFLLQWTSPKHNRIVRATCWGRHGERQSWMLIVLRPKAMFFCCCAWPWEGIPVCQVVWFWSNVLLRINSNCGRLVFVGMIVKHVEDSHHPSAWAPDTDANKLGGLMCSMFPY